MRKRFCLLPALALALLCACSKGAAKTPPTRPADFTSTERQFNTPADGDTIAIFDTSLGEVRAVLYPDAAPMAVYNFVGLARSGYYDNTTIWRSEYGFAVQGGDATGTGTGGSTIWSNNPYPPEASADLKHYAGALCAAFAAGGDVTGGNSQFYFVAALPDSVSSSDRQAELTANGYTDAQIDALYSGDQAKINEAFCGEMAYYNPEDGQLYSIYWLSDHTAEEYENAGIPETEVERILGLAEEAGGGYARFAEEAGEAAAEYAAMN